jgi:hypothetical protein
MASSADPSEVMSAGATPPPRTQPVRRAAIEAERQRIERERAAREQADREARQNFLPGSVISGVRIYSDSHHATMTA